jgi:hypothetical protein
MKEDYPAMKDVGMGTRFVATLLFVARGCYWILRLVA